MSMIVKTRIIKIGDSQGIRIPRFMLEQTNLGAEIELEVQQDRIIVRPARHPRHVWCEVFQAMAELGDDTLLDGDMPIPAAWEEEEWD